MKKSPGRKQKRMIARGTHYNCFTKKYSSFKKRMQAFENCGIGAIAIAKHECLEIPKVIDYRTVFSRIKNLLFKKNNS